MTEPTESQGMPASTSKWLRALLLPLTILAWIAVIVLVGWLLGHVVKTILTLVLSGIVAFALTPLVRLLSRWVPRWMAITLAYVVGFGLIFGLVTLLVIQTTSQVKNLAHNIPNTSTYIRQNIEPTVLRFLKPFGVTHQKFVSAEAQLTKYLSNLGTSVAKDSYSIVSGIVGTIVDIILVLILSVYLTANGPRIASALRQQAPRTQRWRANLMIGIVDQVVGGYIRGMLTLATLIGVVVGVGMFALGIPYAILLGVLAFFMEFIPIIGVMVSGAVCVLVAVPQGWVKIVLVLVYFIFVHVLEGDVVGPRIMGRAVGVHPATALIAFVAGTELFGFWGAIFASPIAGLIQAIGIATWAEYRGRDPHGVLTEDRQASVEQAMRDSSMAVPVTNPRAEPGGLMFRMFGRRKRKAG